MLVTGLPSMVAGMVNAPDAFLSHPVMVTVPSLISYFKLGFNGISSSVLASSLTSCCFSSICLDSATGFSGLTSATDSFSPHPPRSRGSVTMIRNKGTGFMGYFLDSASSLESTGSPLLFQYFAEPSTSLPSL